ncbi:peptide ABC transporter substrate-binding protein [Ktedonobacter sp. SOSP1-85]|uniref:ABC transporter substrate-binding protein n=1 Tax=Ktedonobacter sp. SOSP1-85 TaxID=2778367 RepID=UPI0019154C43|nr:ABC transporter substrate-binding protein [Ktedonobacter sp. SOSP1-85]GHO81209.1 peptide ABC transporter substrate-binding protein [Ktedonobacter sp. SOSP1-85]
MAHTNLLTRKSRTTMACLSLLMLLSLLFVACGGSTTSKSNKSTSLTMLANAGGDYTRNFNPYSSSVISGTPGMIYETLLYFNRLNGDIKPWLAQSYDLASDATSITFHLRKDVKWSDGQPFTSDDVVFTLNLIKQNPSIDVSGISSRFKDVVAPDSSTVTVTLNAPYYPIIWYLGGQTYILPKHVWSAVKGDPSQYADPNPVGTGPFVLKSFTPQLVTLSKNSRFWKPGKPEVSELKIPAYNSNTSAELALQKGEIDWTNLYIPDIEKTYIKLDPVHNHYWFPSSDVVMLFMNITKYPFNQLPVRQAISDAINRDQLNKVGESGYEPAASPTLILPANKDYTAPEYGGLSFSVDAAKAQQLLESAGFSKGGDGIYADKQGKKLTFNLNVVSGYTDWITDCQLIASNLQAIGIKVTVNTIAFDAYYDALQKGNYDLAMLWTNPGPTPYYIFDGLLRSTNSAPNGQAAPSNYERWNDPHTDKLLDQYASSTDPNAQKQAIQALQKIMVEQLPSIPLTNEPYWYQYSTKKFTGWPDAQHPYAAPGTATYPDIEYVVLNLHPVE